MIESNLQAATDLDLFQSASRWKRYWAAHVMPYLGESVIEVGAGIGGSTPFLCDRAQRWVCLEPDRARADRIQSRIGRGELGPNCEAVNGVLADMPRNELCDAILYADVLEHIEDDRSELAGAARRLRAGGHLIVLGPAHEWLFSRFDAAIGHYRRYSKRLLVRLTPEGTEIVTTKYLDSAGMLASTVNRCILRVDQPSQRQIAFWDRVIVPISRCIDPLLDFRIGKSVLVVWRRC